MSSRNIVAAASSLFVFFLIVLSCLNWQSSNLNLFAASINFPLGLAVIIALSAGLLAGLSLAQIPLSRHKTAAAKLQQWQEQDHKLMATVQSDREKQLEAKIATLETALKTALKKSRA